MRRQLHILKVVAIAGIVVGGLGACGSMPAKTFEDDSALQGAITSVRLDNSSGGVELRGKEGADEVSMHRKVEYRGDRPHGATHKVENGVLVLGGCGRHCSVSYSIDLPAGLPVSGETSTGAISLSHVGEVSVSTGSGRIVLDEVTGSVDVRTTNGRIGGRGLAGGRIRAETSNGAIELTPTTSQDIQAKTSNGHITLTVPAGRYQGPRRRTEGTKASPRPTTRRATTGST
ncbi:hypothetical protein [Dactylosporangium sp. NPDC048998]|uniref:hypothetical protein n=1 Tax=Dactylosporangium sp. NPDC048998 TaxID=3363976 RepID=UPI00371C049E